MSLEEIWCCIYYHEGGILTERNVDSSFLYPCTSAYIFCYYITNLQCTQFKYIHYIDKGEKKLFLSAVFQNAKNK